MVAATANVAPVIPIDRLMAVVGPYESTPRLAVAVSGGADSLALCLLVDDWARRQGGSIVALTVDHGLREGSAAEAEQVGAWLAARHIAHHVLTWRGAKPVAGIQAAARDARYGLLTDWCRGAGILHLLLGHQRDDQAETYLMRRQRDSGVDGLAGMAAIVERDGVRCLRPLLDVSRADLRGFLDSIGQDWIEDPSNRDPTFTRVRVRDAMAARRDGGRTAGKIAAESFRMGAARARFDVAVADVLASACRVSPAGFLSLDRTVLAEAADEIALRVLARSLRCIGGTAFGPRRAAVERLRHWLQTATGGGRTLGGCRLVVAGDRLWVGRETRPRPHPIDLKGATRVVWDGRFVIDLNGATEGLHLDRLGRDGWNAVVADEPALRGHPIPAFLRPGLPALWDAEAVREVPHLGYIRGDVSGARIARIVFRPKRPLSGEGFFLASRGLDTIS